ncbi:MAG: hypothetical protein AAB490_00920 [Patescibacteria group bacterium]
MRTKAMKLFVVSLLSIIFFISIGLVVGAGSMGSDHGSMVGCPFMMGEHVLCPMGILEHLATWQKLAGSIPDRFGMIVSLSMVLSVFVLLVAQEMESWRRCSIRLGPRQALYKRIFPNSILFVFVKKLFSQGILNPKIFTAYAA